MARDSDSPGQCGRTRSSIVTVASELKAEEMVLERRGSRRGLSWDPSSHTSLGAACLPEGPAEEAGNEEPRQPWQVLQHVHHEVQHQLGQGHQHPRSQGDQGRLRSGPEGSKVWGTHLPTWSGELWRWLGASGCSWL